jgi:hypothetical protein
VLFWPVGILQLSILGRRDSPARQVKILSRRPFAVKDVMSSDGRKALSEIGTLFTPDTILRWHRQLVANKWDYSDRKETKPGRPRTRQVIVDLVVKFAKENPSWGYDQGDCTGIY